MTTSPPPADWELKPLVVDAPTPPDEPPTPTETSTSHTIILESPASPDPPTPTDDDTKLAAPLQGEYDPEFVGYGVTTSPRTSDTDSLPELRAFSALPKASASMSGPISPTPPTACWSCSSDDDDDDNYRGMVDDCADAIVRHVRCVMNTCCRACVDKEVRACFGVLLQEAMEPAFLDDIINQILE